MILDLEKYSQELREEFIESLIEFSGGAISQEQAEWICMTKFRPTDYFPGSQIIHKGPDVQAKQYVREIGMLAEKYKPIPSKNSQSRLIFD